MVGSLLKKANLSTPHRPSTCAAILFVTSPRFGALKSWKVLVLSYSVTLCRMYTCCYDPRNALSDVNGFRSDKMLYLWSDLKCFEQVWTQHNTLPWNISGSAESPNRYQPHPPPPLFVSFWATSYFSFKLLPPFKFTGWKGLNCEIQASASISLSVI